MHIYIYIHVDTYSYSVVGFHYMHVSVSHCDGEGRETGADSLAALHSGIQGLTTNADECVIGTLV